MDGFSGPYDLTDSSTTTSAQEDIVPEGPMPCCRGPWRYHQIALNTMPCKALHASNFSSTMRCWAIADRSSRLIIAEPRKTTLNGTTPAGPCLERAVRSTCAPTRHRTDDARRPRTWAFPATPANDSSKGIRWGTPFPPPSWIPSETACGQLKRPR